MELYNILIVEDNPEISELFKLALESPEYALSTALNGTEALEKLDVEKPDLVVLDILIPEPNGWKLYEMIRKDPNFSNTRVLITTALTIYPGVLAEKRLRPIDRFMNKPFDIDKLKLIVKELLAGISMKNVDNAHHHPREHSYIISQGD
jgi:DNA-binding response OmpR family regulator